MEFTNPLLALKALFANQIFLSAIVSFLVSQILKAIITFFSQHEKNIKEVIITLLWNTGGMPSSHSALVTSMATASAIYDGVGSSSFAISLFLALIVIRDALGVRRAAGMQAKAINIIGRTISDKLNVDCPPVKEIQGHSPLETIIGALIGILSAVLFCKI